MVMMLFLSWLIQNWPKRRDDVGIADLHDENPNGVGDED
jgi:hypothetical protein